MQALIDATDDNTANIAIGYAQAVVSGFSSDVQVEAAAMTGSSMRSPPTGRRQSRGSGSTRTLKAGISSFPGVVAMVMALVGAELTSLTIAREWERGTMELLVSTPVTPMEVMLGKLLPYFGIGLLDAAFCLAYAIFWFGVPFRGTLATLFFTTSLFLVVVLGIGYLISTAIRTQVGAAQIGLLVTLLPTSLLSGMAFPIDQMPPLVQGSPISSSRAITSRSSRRCS